MVYKIENYGGRFKLTCFKTFYQFDKMTSQKPLSALDFITDMDIQLRHNEMRKLVADICKPTERKKTANNLSRTKARVQELALCNPWEYFVTMTINADKQDRYALADYVKALGVWIGNYNKKYNTKLSYLIVPEQHKDGAWHCHGLFNGVASESLTINNNGYLDMPYYRNRFGYISLDKIRDENKCSTYISKYIVKQYYNNQLDGVESGKHMFYASRGLAGKVLIESGNIDEYKLWWLKELERIEKNEKFISGERSQTDGLENKNQDNKRGGEQVESIQGSVRMWNNDYVDIFWSDDLADLERIVGNSAEV